MTIKEVSKIVNGTIIKDGKFKDKKIKNIEINSQKITKKDIFVALKGKNFDGHDFISEAIKKGAAAIIVDKDIVIDSNVSIIKVDDTYESLLLLAEYKRNKYQIPLIAITGSVGKTTTKELIFQILSKKYNVLKSEESNNNHIGMPLTLFKLNKKHQIIVLELGMNHSGEISKLSKVCKPDISIITNIGTSHIGNLGSKKNIFKAKLEILDGMKQGKLIVNGDDKYLKKIETDKVEVIKYSIKNNKDLYIFDIKSDIDKTCFKLKYQDIYYDVVFPVPGLHLLSNLLLAIKTALFFELDIEDIIRTISNYKPVSKRMNMNNLIDNITVINDCYNSSYESLIGVLDLIKHDDRKKILIIGDILELGTYSKKNYLKILKKLKKINNKEVFFVGIKHRKKIKNYHYFDNNSSVVDYLNNYNCNDCLILIKGSRALKLEKIYDFIIKKYKNN